jgi:hypothetical protein
LFIQKTIIALKISDIGTYKITVPHFLLQGNEKILKCERARLSHIALHINPRKRVLRKETNSREVTEVFSRLS